MTKINMINVYVCQSRVEIKAYMRHIMEQEINGLLLPNNSPHMILIRKSAENLDFIALVVFHGVCLVSLGPRITKICIWRSSLTHY